MRFLTLVLFCALPFGRPSFADPPAQRIVSLAPSLTELLYDVGWGDRLVGRSDADDYPPEATALPVAGSFGRPNVEWLLREKPDLVVSTDLERPGLAATLRSGGVCYLRLPCNGWKEMLDAVSALGEALGDTARADQWIARAQARRDALAEHVKHTWGDRPRPRVYIELWSDPLTTPGRDSFLTDLVSLAGGISLGADLRDPYAHIAAEWVINEKPDAIVLAYMMAAIKPDPAALAKRPGWGAIPAIRNQRITADIPTDWLLRPGPRWIQAAEALAAFLENATHAE